MAVRKSWYSVNTDFSTVKLGPRSVKPVKSSDTSGLIKTYPCDSCSKLFLRATTLRSHKTNDCNKNYFCPQCKMQFSYRASFCRHRKNCTKWNKCIITAQGLLSENIKVLCLNVFALAVAKSLLSSHRGWSLSELLSMRNNLPFPPSEETRPRCLDFQIM